MIAVDPNVLVRFLTRDDVAQARKARALIEKEKVWISVSVLLETAWVLLDRKGIAKTDVIGSLESLIRLPNVAVESADRVDRALGWARGGLDIADAFHLSAADECERFATFDRRLAKRTARLGANPPVVEP